jgi:hypothetical protein
MFVKADDWYSFMKMIGFRLKRATYAWIATADMAPLSISWKQEVRKRRGLLEVGSHEISSYGC